MDDVLESPVQINEDLVVQGDSENDIFDLNTWNNQTNTNYAVREEQKSPKKQNSKKPKSPSPNRRQKEQVRDYRINTGKPLSKTKIEGAELVI